MDYKTAVALIGQNSSPDTLGQLIAEMRYWDAKESRQLIADLVEESRPYASSIEIAIMQRAMNRRKKELIAVNGTPEQE